MVNGLMYEFANTEKSRKIIISNYKRISLMESLKCVVIVIYSDKLL